MLDAATLPKRTQDFHAGRATEGTRNREAFEAAAQCRDAGATEAEAVQLIEAGAARCGLPLAEARNAVKSAFKKPAREPITKHGDNGDKPTGKRRVVARYDYNDETGALLYQVERTDPKGFRQRRPDGHGGWLYNLGDTRRVLYRLPEVVKATEVWVVEGEKDADTLAALGFTATTNPMGAGKKWRDSYSESLRGKQGFIIPDNDAPGRAHAEQVACALHGVAASVRVLRLPDTAKDVTEFVGTFNDETEAAERLSILAEGAAEWTPTPDADPTPETRKPIVRSLSAFTVASDPTNDPLNLLGRRFLCRGGALLMAGPTGIGKSSLLLQAAISWALGRPLFGIAPTGKLRTLLIQAENDDGDVSEMRDGVYRGLNLTPEEQAEAGAAVEIVCESTKTGLEFIGLVDALLAEHKPDLLMTDPLFAYCGCNVSDQEKMSVFLRNGLNPRLQAHGCGLILAHHSNKPPSGREKPDWKAGDFAYLGSGTSELANWSRSVIAMRSVGSHKVFEIVLGKRGKRAGLVDDEGQPVYSFFIKHGSLGICWEPATEDDLPGDDDGRHAVAIMDVVAEFGDGCLLNYSKLVELLSEKHGVSARTAKRAIARAAGDRKIKRTSSGFYELSSQTGDK